MSESRKKEKPLQSAREKFLGLSLESTRKSYYPQLREQLAAAMESERRLQLLIDSIPAGIAYIDTDERYVFVNRGYETTFGLERDQIVGEQVAVLNGEENYANAKPYIDAALAGNGVQFEIPFIAMSGDRYYMDITYAPDTDERGNTNGFYVLALDITDKKRAEKEKAKLEANLQQSQKFEAIGTLAGGIAHDFNNLLMGIQGRASLMAADLEAGHPYYEQFREIETYIRSASELTRQLLGIARGGKYETQPIDINEIVAESATLFGRTKKEIHIHRKLSEARPIVEADKNQINQVLLNLYVNAWQAMPTGGDLYLETRRLELDETFCQQHLIDPGAYVQLTVTDTGIGIDASIQDKIFDPFFTTKGKRHGTGLGLASAYGIIQNHNGIITVDSEVGQGATFCIYLPVTDTHTPSENGSEGGVVTGTETILLIDDEEMILSVGEAMLSKLGYTVVTASSGEGALNLIAGGEHPIELVILDLIMPDMDGEATFDRIRKMMPQLPVMLSSGYAMDGKAADIMSKGCNGFIQKPFSISELSLKVREVLDALRNGSAPKSPVGPS
jgi:two-component system cell cycle sensor histidine kinase/response regulator CckA